MSRTRVILIPSANKKWSKWSGLSITLNMARIRSNRVCFTLNNYSLEDIINITNLESDPRIQFLVAGLEEGQNGTPHIQGFINIKEDPKKCGVRYWKGFLPNWERCHFENARGTDEQNEQYCTKDGPFIKFGEPSTQNFHQKIFETAKTDVAAAVAIDFEFGIKNYHALKSIFDDHQQASCRSTLEKLRDWQKIACQKLANQSDRKILFIVDEEGGKGKSALAKHLLSQGNAWGVSR